jgi:hypothetical protein
VAGETADAGRAARSRPYEPRSRIAGLQPDGPDNWSNGSLYDPQDGNIYDVTAERIAPDRLSARVYRGVPFFGRTEILIRDPQLGFDGRC